MQKLLNLLKEKNIKEEEVIKIIEERFDFDKKNYLIELEKIISFWNNKFDTHFRITDSLIEEYKKVRKRHSKKDIKLAITNYIRIAIPESYKKYRLSPFKFFKQNNGFDNFLNM